MLYVIAKHSSPVSVLFFILVLLNALKFNQICFCLFILHDIICYCKCTPSETVRKTAQGKNKSDTTIMAGLQARYSNHV